MQMLIVIKLLFIVINVCCSDKYDKVEKTRTDKDDRKDRSKDSQVF